MIFRAILRCVSRFHASILLVGVAVFLHSTSTRVLGKSPEASKDPTRDRLEARIDEKLAPVYRAGNQAAVQNVLASIMKQLDASGVEELDDLLSDAFLPSTAEILARMHLGRASGKVNLKRPSPREAALVLAHAKQSIDETLAQREWVSMLDPNRKPESSFEEYERAIWDAHVYRNQLENAIKKTAVADRFQSKHLKAIKKKQPGFLETDCKLLTKKLYRARVELHERDLRLKLDRVAFATQTLKELEQLPDEDADTVATARRRIWSVYVLQKDGETLLRAMKEYEKPGKEFLFLDELNKPKSRSAERKKINVGRKLVGRDVLERSEHLFDGLHWWFRGRYGRGTHNLGLLKLPAAAHNIKAQNALRMPKQPPRPTDPAMFAMKSKPTAKFNAASRANEPTANGTKGIVPGASPSASDTSREQPEYVYGVAYDKRYARSPDYDRRHHYIWSQKPPMFVTQSVSMFFH